MAPNFKYAAYRLDNGQQRIGSLDIDKGEIQPLAYTSGTPLRTLYEVIEAGEESVIESGPVIALKSVTLLSPISGRDILAVGKNYADHAVEFNTSGYDSSDKTDQPTHPVIFTKRQTSIMAHGDEIFEHKGFTETLDYEGELGIIVGKAGFRISEEDAMNHVWGYTIINDVTARERQRDHKQFYIGKAPDTFCPMGPVAIPKERLEKVLRVQTFVNGEKRQDATTNDLIFSILFLMKTCSAGITMQPGDVIASGTPAGVGFGQKPPVWLKRGDRVDVSITGLGTLSNTISASPTNPTVARVASISHIPEMNVGKSLDCTIGLTTINSKKLYVKRKGSDSKPPIFFVHGLGGTSEIYYPLISDLGLEKSHSLWLSDLEGHGNSPTRANSVLSVSSFTDDLFGIFEHAGVSSDAILIAHSMGCLVAQHFVLKRPGLVKKLILLGPPQTLIPDAGWKYALDCAASVRKQGMEAVIDGVIDGTSEKTRMENPIAIAAIRLSVLSQDPECYAKATSAFVYSTIPPDLENIKANVLIVTGSEDKVSTASVCKEYSSRLSSCRVTILKHVGHWHIFEDLQGVSKAVRDFI